MSAVLLVQLMRYTFPFLAFRVGIIMNIIAVTSAVDITTMGVIMMYPAFAALLILEVSAGS